MMYLYFLPFYDEIYKSKIEIIRGKFSAEKEFLSDAGKLLAKFAASQKVGIPMRDITITKTSSGKPFFENIDGVYFSISHADGAVAVALAESEVGVDVEKIKKAPMKVAKRFFSHDEIEYIEKNSDKNRAFFEIWTKKEAVAKQIGEGLKREKLRQSIFERKIATFEKNGYIISACAEIEDGVTVKEGFVEEFLKECERMIQG